MRKKGIKENPTTNSGDEGFKEFISISALRTNEGFHIVQMFGYDIRVDVRGIEPWFVVQDFSDALGIARNTIPKMIERNSSLFEGWVSSVDVTYPEEKSSKLKNLNNSGSSLLVMNEQATYSVLSRLSSGRMKSELAKVAVLKFQRAFPELLKMIRTGELIVVKNEEWDLKRYLSKDGYKRMSKSIHDFINTLARNPEHEIRVHTNNAIMINKIVFGQHFKGIRDTATIKQLEAVYALDSLNSSLIEQGINVQKERQKILTDYYNRHFGDIRVSLPKQSLLFNGCELNG
jgi:prophage antirepressor-like protein